MSDDKPNHAVTFDMPLSLPVPEYGARVTFSDEDGTIVSASVIFVKAFANDLEAGHIRITVMPR